MSLVSRSALPLYSGVHEAVPLGQEEYKEVTDQIGPSVDILLRYVGPNPVFYLVRCAHSIFQYDVNQVSVWESIRVTPLPAAVYVDLMSHHTQLPLMKKLIMMDAQEYHFEDNLIMETTGTKVDLGGCCFEDRMKKCDEYRLNQWRLGNNPYMNPVLSIKASIEEIGLQSLAGTQLLCHMLHLYRGNPLDLAEYMSYHDWFSHIKNEFPFDCIYICVGTKV